jgi:hypothetical protein
MRVRYIVFLLSIQVGAAIVPCPIPPIDTGFGAAGHYDVKADSFENPISKTHRIYTFVPVKAPRDLASPVILFCHGLGSAGPSEYRLLINHIVSRGNIVIYPEFPVLGVQARREERKYSVLSRGFSAGIARLGASADTTRIGVVGHSFGGGAVPAIAWKTIFKNRWGSRGLFLYIMAPWYSFEIEPEQLESFPDSIPLIVQTFAEDQVNDTRMAVDLFDNIGIASENKNFIVVQGDKRFECVLSANHATPTGSLDSERCVDALDYYGVYRLIDALAATAFFHDPNGRHIALGHGNPDQRFMGRWPDGVPVSPLIVTDSPQASREQFKYLWFWDNDLNPRKTTIESDTTIEQRTSFSDRLHTYAMFFKSGRYYFKIGRKTLRVEHRNTGPVPPIAAGYGADGSYEVESDSLPHPRWPGHSVYVFRPADSGRKYPAILFSHGYNKSSPFVYQPLINHLVSRGNVVIFSPFRDFNGDPDQHRKYAMLFDGFCFAVRHYQSIIDTTTMGFAGHSFGGGATPAIAWKAIRENRWGTRAAFMFVMAPWYSYEITPGQLAEFPAHVKLVVEVFGDDRMNDFRMAEDVFKHLSIDKDEKEFVVVNSDSGAGYVFRATHSTPKGAWDPRGAEDGLDYFGVWKIFDALEDYSLTGSPAAKKAALGHGSQEQIFMGTWLDGKPVKPLTVLKNPDIQRPGEGFVFSWDNAINPRRELNEKK